MKNVIRLKENVEYGLSPHNGGNAYQPLVFVHKNEDGNLAYGTTNEAVLEMLIDRLSVFQNGEESCRENAIAITKLEEAKMWLESRAKREEV